MSLNDAAAEFLSFAVSHLGFAAQAGPWINAPVRVEHHAGRAAFAQVSERIVEIPYAFRALARLPPDARVLDVGGVESTLALSARPSGTG